ncbi:MAG: DNA alkylation repair protein [Odoribacteraceae bacterium]|nr:DNA alkylation repair protein [Odoribacteraceae bacterium]
MPTELHEIMNELNGRAQPAKAAILARFFKTGQGEYGEGDRFIGVTVPAARAIAAKHAACDLDTLHELLHSPVHEHRLTALLVLTLRFQKSQDPEDQEKIVRFYTRHADRVNNWDLVDLSCYKILGPWLEERDKSLLHAWAHAGHLWQQRIAMVTCMHFVRKGRFDDCFAIADILQHHPHDLIQKAVGWLLREVGKRDRQALTRYLLPRYRHMPRTMLRYAIEHYDESARKQFLAGTRTG